MKIDIAINNLHYYYNKNNKVLDNININVPEGSIYGFLGPNGAGKSTTMSLIAGILPDEHNCISILGKPISKQIPSIYAHMACMIENPSLYMDLSGLDNMKIIAAANKLQIDRLIYYLNLVELSEKKNLKVKTYSMGMRQRLAIAMALCKDPKILLLDEPVNGLDPNGMAEIRNLLVKLNKELGITIFISSHLLAEIEKMCTHIGIIHKGKMMYEGTINELKDSFDKSPLHIETDQLEEANSILVQHQYTVRKIDNHLISVDIIDKHDIPKIIQTLTHYNISIYKASQDGNLESWFLNLTQQ